MQKLTLWYTFLMFTFYVNNDIINVTKYKQHKKNIYFYILAI